MGKMGTNIANVRFIHHKNTEYLRKEDIIELLLYVAEAEPTDTRLRLEELAENIEKIKNQLVN
jgi:hypothetical protein